MDPSDHSDDDARRPARPAAPLLQQQQPGTTRSSESKPRLSKDAQDLLERHFAAEPKPSTNTKKGFAGELGVPLDKINNWFQNRRAKVKQDAKKARNQQSYDLFYHNGFSTDGLNTESFINPSFYTTVDPGMPHPILVNDPGMQMAPEMLIAPFQTGPQFVQALPAPQHYPTYAAYNPEPELTQFFGLDNGTMANGPPTDPGSVAAFGDQFKAHYIGIPAPGAADAYAAGGNALYAMDGAEQMQCHPPQMPHMPLHSASRQPSSSMTSMTTGYSADSRNSSTSWTSPADADASHVPFGLRNLRDRIDSIHHCSVNQTVLEEPVADFDALHPSSPDEPSSLSLSGDSLTATAASFNLHRNLTIDTSSLPQTCAPSALVYQTTEGSSGSRSEQLSPVFSPASELGPSPTNTVIPRAPSSLATRRQKRPAALGITTMRSTSYGSAAPSSPGSVALAPEQATLRRIKSSNYVMTGRIQKSGAGSAQRSPMSLSFKEADSLQSPRAPRHFASARSLHDLTDNKATPSIAEHEAEEMAGQEIDMDASSIWHQMPSTAGTTYSSAMWSQPPNTGDSISFTSAPPTPLDVHNFEQMRMHNASMSDMAHMVSGSAPPWQESFSSDHSTTAGSDMMLNSQLTFRPSTSSGPETMSHMMASSGPGFMQMLPAGMTTSSGGAPDMPTQDSQGQDCGPSGHIPMYSVHADGSMMPPPALIVPSSELSATPRLAPELHIQAWEPRELAEEADLPPKRASASLPKNYQFNNQFLTTFASPSSG